MYRPVASSIRCARPICGEGGRTSFKWSPSMSISIFASSPSGSLKPSRPKNLIPLSWYGLWEAEMTTPASARLPERPRRLHGHRLDIGDSPHAVGAEQLPSHVFSLLLPEMDRHEDVRIPDDFSMPFRQVHAGSRGEDPLGRPGLDLLGGKRLQAGKLV